MNHYKRRPSDIFVFKKGVYGFGKLWRDKDTGKTQRKKRILFLATWSIKKGKDTLVEAEKMLHERKIKLRWLLAGTGNGEKDVIKEWPEFMRYSVEIIKYFIRDEEQEIYAFSRVFVLPSRFEGQPLSLLQAMWQGMCCIASRCCGQKDIIKHGYNGFLFTPGDRKELARIIAKCIKDSKMASRIGQNARESVKERGWGAVSEEVAEKLLKFFLQHKAKQESY